MSENSTFKQQYLWGPLSYYVAIILIVSIIFDQVTKHFLVNALELKTRGAYNIAPFFNLVYVENRGISYGLFQQTTIFGRIILSAISFGASIFLWAWSVRVKEKLTGYSLGLIIGGALGNGIDRAFLGPVIDFLHFFVGNFSWYVFNIADVCIVVGVVGVLFDSFFGKSKSTTQSE